MFSIAAKQSLSGEHTKHRLGAVIEKGGRIISTGYNQLRYTKELKSPTLHAEAAAILKVLKEGRQHQLVNATIYVSRYTKGGNIGLARPCSSCMDLIRSVGISRIAYTTDDNTTISEKVV